MSQSLVYLSDNLIELRGLTDTLTDAPVTDATVTVTLTDLKTGTAIDGETWPLAMTHVSAGTYRATLNEDLDVRKGQALRAAVTATKDTTTRTWREIVWVRESD